MNESKRDAEQAAAFSQLAAVLAEQMSAATRTSIGMCCSIATGLGIPHEIQQEAIERALLLAAVGTWQQRVERMTGKPASPADGLDAMAAVIDDPHAKSAPAPEHIVVPSRVN